MFFMISGVLLYMSMDNFIILRDAELKLEPFDCRLHLLQKKQSDCKLQELSNFLELSIISTLRASQNLVRCFLCNFRCK